MLSAPLDTCVCNTQHRGNPASNSELKLSQALNVYRLGIYTECSRISHQCGACSDFPHSITCSSTKITCWSFWHVIMWQWLSSVSS